MPLGRTVVGTYKDIIDQGRKPLPSFMILIRGGKGVDAT
jgi:hypothetical protein